MKKRETLSRWLIAPLLVGLLWTSCAKEEVAVLDVPTSAEQVASTKVEQSPFLTEEEAEAQAANLYAAFFADELRSSRPPRVKDVRLLDPFRSSQDSLGGIYVVNFENNGGYIMMAEHRYGEPILAACPQGNFDPEKASENPNFAPILANMRALVAAGPQQGDIDGKLCPPALPGPDTNPRDPGYPGNPGPRHPADPGPAETTVGSWFVDEHIEPLVKAKWSQGYPFSQHLKRIKGKLPKVGCVAIAIAQIMSFHKRPLDVNWEEVVGITSYSEDKWDSPETKKSSKLADLLKRIGELVDMDYGLESSGAYDEDVPNTFHKLGYECEKTIYNYDWIEVYKEIRQMRPVYVSGSRIKEKTKILFIPITSYQGHAWVIDGIKVLRRTITTMRRDTTPLDPTAYDDEPDRHRYKVTTHNEYKYLVHCNLGWGGGGDAYYYSGIFDIGNAPEELRSLRDDIHNQDDGRRYYQFDMKVIKGIYPKN